MIFYSEGENPHKAPYTHQELESAFQTHQILECRAVAFNSKKQLVFHLGSHLGIMPYEECAYGIQEGLVRDIAILTRVGRLCSFMITQMPVRQGEPCILSRRIAQLHCQKKKLDALYPGDLLDCKVTSLESFGAFCDIGCGISALLPIDCMSVSRIASPKDRLILNQNIHCLLKQRDTKGRFVLTMKELLGTWQENAALYTVGETVIGIVRSIESYGIFIELQPNLTGLAEPTACIKAGQLVSVYIKNISAQKMKIKLTILNSVDSESLSLSLPYHLPEKRISIWSYSPECCAKKIQSIF